LFKTNKGNFTVDVKRYFSPLGVDRFYYLVTNGYYDGNRFFRVVPNFVVQWGINGDPEINKIWDEFGINDEPVKLSNFRGAIAFARGGPNTRSNQLFINYKDNLRLDTTNYNGVKGFPAFGRVIRGMEIVDSIYSGYRQKPDQDSIQAKGNDYLESNFPKLDYIIEAEIIE
jgi:cyclophilin family peptidyl-prolyl cis-trans isomerase